LNENWWLSGTSPFNRNSRNPNPTPDGLRNRPQNGPFVERFVKSLITPSLLSNKEETIRSMKRFWLICQR
jgi:hypothetical protein